MLLNAGYFELDWEALQGVSWLRQRSTSERTALPRTGLGRGHAGGHPTRWRALRRDACRRALSAAAPPTECAPGLPVPPGLGRSETRRSHRQRAPACRYRPATRSIMAQLDRVVDEIQVLLDETG